jgi:hypothetical protein
MHLSSYSDSPLAAVSVEILANCELFLHPFSYLTRFDFSKEYFTFAFSSEL